MGKLCASLFIAAVLPAADPPNLPVQRLGANDLIAVSVYDAPELTGAQRIGADGFLKLPMLEQPINAQGLLPNEVAAAIGQALRDGQIILEPIVTVSVVEYTSRPISVAGAVKQPLTFQAAGPVTLLEALTRAGGLTPEAGPEILVTSASAPRRIPVKPLMDAADPTLNLALTGGELIRVPEAAKVYVVGNVKKPGAFPVHDDAGTTVLKILAHSEGLLPFAAKQAYIYRPADGGHTLEITVPLDQILRRKAPDMPLLANDIFYVPDNKGRRLTLGAIEKVLIYGAGAATAGIYAGVR